MAKQKIEPKHGDKRKLFSVCIGFDPILLRGWGLSPAEAIKDLKRNRMRECLQMALGRGDKVAIERAFFSHLDDSDDCYCNDRWSYDVYSEEYDAERGEWVTRGTDYWTPKFVIKLGL